MSRYIHQGVDLIQRCTHVHTQAHACFYTHEYTSVHTSIHQHTSVQMCTLQPLRKTLQYKPGHISTHEGTSVRIGTHISTHINTHQCTSIRMVICQCISVHSSAHSIVSQHPRNVCGYLRSRVSSLGGTHQYVFCDMMRWL